MINFQEIWQFVAEENTYLVLELQTKLSIVSSKTGSVLDCKALFVKKGHINGLPSEKVYGS